MSQAALFWTLWNLSRWFGEPEGKTCVLKFQSQLPGVGTVWLAECRTRDQKVASLNPGRSCWEKSLLQSEFSALTLTWCPSHPCVMALACQRLWSFCQKGRWQVTHKHVYALDPMSWSGLTKLSRHSVGTYEGNKLTQIVGECSTTHLGSLSHCGLILG